MTFQPIKFYQTGTFTAVVTYTISAS